MEPTDHGDDGTTVENSCDENSLLKGSDGDKCSVLITEGGDEGHPTCATEVAHIPVVNDVPNTEMSSGIADSFSSDMASQKEEKCEGSESDNELSQKIITQVEYYFSDDNLVKDTFLMQRINRDKRGCVDLKLIASFKKMKKLTQDINVIATALHNSKKLEVNKAGTMVRRVAPLPVTKEEAAALKTVVAVNFNETGNLSEQFGSCGTVSRVRIVSKNDTVPSDVRKHLRRSLDDSGRAVIPIALIEYDDDKSAQTACDSLTDSSDWRHGLHVSMLVARPSEKKSSSNKLSPTKETSNAKSRSENAEGEMQSLRNKKKSGKKNRSRIEAIRDESAGCSSSGSETESQEEQKEHKVSSSKSRARDNRAKGSGSPAGRSNFARSILAHHKASLADDLHGEVRARSGSAGEIEYSSHGISPWVQRRLQAAKLESKSAGGSMTDLSSGDTVSTSKSTDLISVLRQPRGPDGTRGFKLVR